MTCSLRRVDRNSACGFKCLLLHIVLGHPGMAPAWAWLHRKFGIGEGSAINSTNRSSTRSASQHPAFWLDAGINQQSGIKDISDLLTECYSRRFRYQGFRPKSVLEEKLVFDRRWSSVMMKNVFDTSPPDSQDAYMISACTTTRLQLHPENDFSDSKKFRSPTVATLARAQLFHPHQLTIVLISIACSLGVCNENCIGILKMRFRSLRQLWYLIAKQRRRPISRQMGEGCCVLQNVLLETKTERMRNDW